MTPSQKILRFKRPDESPVGGPIRIFIEQRPEAGTAIEVEESIWWIRLPISNRLQFVNAYLLDDGDDGWTLVDTGTNQADSAAALQQVMNLPPFNQRSIARVVTTHFHPDHCGQVGRLVRAGARWLTSRQAWKTAHRLWNQQTTLPDSSYVDFMIQAGLTGLPLESFRRTRPFVYADRVDQPPHPCEFLSDGHVIRAAGRRWTVRFGQGHAIDQVTLWSDSGEAIVGDQILPAVAPNLSVHYSNPDEPTVSRWLQSCRRFQQLARIDTLCLPGHDRPFTGIPQRCAQLHENSEKVLSRLDKFLVRPATAIDCLDVIYHRQLSDGEHPLLLAEAVGYLNCLVELGRVTRMPNHRGQYLYRRSK